MTCTGAFASAADFASFFQLSCQGNEFEMATTTFLEITASDIHVAMAASGMCDCTLAAWAANFLKKLNIVDTAVMYMNPCGPQLNDAQRELFMNWINAQLEAIRTGKLELCAGETGSEFPALDWATPRLNEWTAAQIVANDAEKNS